MMAGSGCRERGNPDLSSIGSNDRLCTQLLTRTAAFYSRTLGALFCLHARGRGTVPATRRDMEARRILRLRFGREGLHRKPGCAEILLVEPRTDLVALLDERDLKNKAMQDQLQAKLEAEQALNASQAKFLAIFDISPLPMVVARIDERSSLDDSSQSMTALDANEAFLQLAQIRRHEVASLKWSELFESVRELDETVRGLRRPRRFGSQRLASRHREHGTGYVRRCVGCQVDVGAREFRRLPGASKRRVLAEGRSV